MIGFWIATYRVWRGHYERVCAPGKWKVWREGGQVKREVLK